MIRKANDKDFVDRITTNGDFTKEDEEELDI